MAAIASSFIYLARLYIAARLSLTLPCYGCLAQALPNFRYRIHKAAAGQSLLAARPPTHAIGRYCCKKVLCALIRNLDSGNQQLGSRSRCEHRARDDEEDDAQHPAGESLPGNGVYNDWLEIPGVSRSRANLAATSHRSQWPLPASKVSGTARPISNTFARGPERHETPFLKRSAISSQTGRADSQVKLATLPAGSDVQRAPYLFWAFFAFPSAEHGLSFEQLSPMTPIAWISISIPGRAKFVTVISALPG
jgi:hypothetical protein